MCNTRECMAVNTTLFFTIQMDTKYWCNYIQKIESLKTGYNNMYMLGILTSGAGTAYPSRPPKFTPGFQWGSCYSIFSFMCMFCRSLFVLLYFFFWPLCCLFFFDIQILIIPLVFSNSSYFTYFNRIGDCGAMISLLVPKCDRQQV